MKWLYLLVFFAGCAAAELQDAPNDGDDPANDRAAARLGATVTSATVTFRVASEHATRIEVWIYAQPMGAAATAHYVLTPNQTTHVFSRSVSRKNLPPGTIYYGYRAWGPNWPYDSAWTPGTEIGFRADVDDAGNRFNPNKLLLDPYALEVSHDPLTPSQTTRDIYASGPGRRAGDSAPVAPKGIALAWPTGDVGPRPTRPLRDEIIYEVHVRGLTQNDPSVPEALRGTFAGAARKAAYLRDLGVTAVEFLPVQETQNDTNDVLPTTDGDNYWGYATLAWFAPDRRYAADRSPGGPTRELRDMVAAFHREGLKVYLDVVYNHTGEGGLRDQTGDVAEILSWRGLDDITYYQHASSRFYYDNSGVGPNFSAAQKLVRDQIVASLRYLSGTLGVDGFRFDLAPVLGNACTGACFRFDKLDPDNVLNRAVVELPARPDDGGAGVDLIAEPWAIGDGTYQVGGFPWGWSEWNGVFRDTIRAHQNLANVPPAELARRVAGSSDLYQDDGRKPAASVNFVVAHDGLTLDDLYACNRPDNAQAWPYGPSDGGTSNNLSWDHDGDRSAQRQAARTGMALLMLSAGVPMMTGGDEMLRSLRCNNNAYNLDSVGNWLDWGSAGANASFTRFVKRLLAFRRAHPQLRPAAYGFPIAWLRDDGGQADAGYLDDSTRHFLAWRLDGDPSIYVAYNGYWGWVTATLPPPPAGRRWVRVSDTAAWMENQDNFVADADGDVMDGPTYGLSPRSLLILVSR